MRAECEGGGIHAIIYTTIQQLMSGLRGADPVFPLFHYHAIVWLATGRMILDRHVGVTKTLFDAKS